VRSRSGEWPGGSSLPGFTFGVVGGIIILFEFLLLPRKWKRSWRLGRVQVWMRAHIWLGLLTVPLLILHSGFRLGGTLSAALLIILLVVVASGLWGLALQQYLPKRMLENLPAETIYSQIEHVSRSLRAEAERLVLATSGAEAGDVTPVKMESASPQPSSSHLVIGALRAVGDVQGKVLQTRVPRTPVSGSDSLREFYRSIVLPFLEGRAEPDSPLHFPRRTAVLFEDLRTKLDPAAHEVLGSLENICEQRRQFDLQARLYFWLHSWLWAHVPLSVVLALLMLVHAWFAVKYW
jgi:hypothetical protein